MCSLSRYVVIGGFTGMAVASVSGSDLAGWLGAAAAVALIAAAGRLFPGRLGSPACSLPPADRVVPSDTVDEVARPR